MDAAKLPHSHGMLQSKIFPKGLAIGSPLMAHAFHLGENGLIKSPEGAQHESVISLTGVPRNPRVPQKAVEVPPISKFDWYLLVNCS